MDKEPKGTVSFLPVLEEEESSIFEIDRIESDYYGTDKVYKTKQFIEISTIASHEVTEVKEGRQVYYNT
jgi:hypothetical protein